jgi:hypothetical protein
VIEAATIAIPRHATAPRVPDAVLDAQRRVLTGELTAKQANRALGGHAQRQPDRHRRERALREARKRVDGYRRLTEA